MKRYRYTFLLLIIVLLLQTSALANDGGYSPDYNDYIIYEVDTDCKEVEIGGTIKYTLTMKNKTKHLFEAIFIDRSIENTTISNDDYLEYRDHEHGLDAYETRVIEMEITVPEHVDWYQKNGEYFINLKPEISYWPDETEGNAGMGWGYMNMIGVEPIPIKILNLNDGTDKVSMDFIDDRNTVYFYNAVEYDWERNESNTYTGQYDGDIENYISIKNNTNEELELVYINSFRYWFTEYDNNPTLCDNDKISINSGHRYFIMPDDIPKAIDIRYNATFKDKNGDLYAVGIERSCNTKVLDISDLHLNIELKNDRTVATITNKSNEEIEDLVVEYYVRAAETLEEQEKCSITTALKQGESIIIVNIPYGKEDDDSNSKVSNLRVGFVHQDVFIYSKIQLDFEKSNKYEGKAEDAIVSSWYIDFYNTDNHIELVDLKGVLRGDVAYKKPRVIPTASPEPTPIASPKVTPTVEISPGPTIKNTPAPKVKITPTTTEKHVSNKTDLDEVSTPVKEISETKKVNVISDKSFLVNSWIYVCLAVVIVVLVALTIFKRITYTRKE